MATKDYKYDFKALKSKVGVDDIAASIGYVVNRRAGLGRYIEMVLPDGGGKKEDTIIISHPGIVYRDRGDKSQQKYFRRDGSRPGDVISFIVENGQHFGINSTNKWEVIGQVLSKFANDPARDYYQGQSLREHADMKFNPDQYEIEPVSKVQNTDEKSQAKDNALNLFEQRGIRKETVEAFAKSIDFIRDKRTSYTGYNIGFRYTKPGEEKSEGYEIRGYGSFKRKATGTNSTSAAWIVSPKEVVDPTQVSHVFFAESAYDIMAFYQQNKQRLDALNTAEGISNSVFVSIGGTFSSQQVKGIMDYYSNAAAVDCFDNDLPGRIYGMRMMSVVENLNLGLMRDSEGIHVKYGDKDYVLDADKANINDLKAIVNPKRKFMEWKAPENFKDWNDVVMNRPYKQEEQKKSKYDRDESLRQKRAGIKM